MVETKQQTQKQEQSDYEKIIEIEKRIDELKRELDWLVYKRGKVYGDITPVERIEFAKLFGYIE